MLVVAVRVVHIVALKSLRDVPVLARPLDHLRTDETISLSVDRSCNAETPSLRVETHRGLHATVVENRGFHIRRSWPLVEVLVVVVIGHLEVNPVGHLVMP